MINGGHNGVLQSFINVLIINITSISMLFLVAALAVPYHLYRYYCYLIYGEKDVTTRSLYQSVVCTPC